VWYDDAWHYFDLDVRGALMKPDGTIASLAEARKNRKLWVNPEKKVEPFFPKDRDKDRVFRIYRDSHIDYYYRWFQMGHVMDFRLRQGESVTRWWRPQGGRWHHLKSYNRGFVRKLLLKEPRGYKSNHTEFSVWTQGNGLWHYAPDLTDSSSDFEDGVRSVKNLEPGPKGLTLVRDGVGEAVFEMFTPWIIVAKINGLDDASDDSEAALVRLVTAAPVTVAVSADQGRSWHDAATVGPGKKVVDLTRWVKGTYGYLLRLRAAGGEAGQVAVRSMSADTWVQVAPISLPRLKAGVNKCRYGIGDRYGKATVPMFVLPNTADPDDLKQYVLDMPKDYNPKRKTARMRGDVVLKLEAPEGTGIGWFTAGAAFTTHQGGGAKNTDNRIAYAVGEPKEFKEVYKADVPTWVNHWRYQWDEDVRLERPAKTVFVKYTGKPAVNVLRATVHLTPETKSDTAIRITHGYKLGGKLVEEVVDMKQPGDYTVEVNGEPENVFIRMAVPSKTK
ncbi:MAG: hypothetical protein ACODAJ_02280, partial [Planctomycetota bacterium]